MYVPGSFCIPSVLVAEAAEKIQGIDSCVVAVVEEQAIGVASDGLHVAQVNADGDGIRVQNLDSRDFVNAMGAGAFLAKHPQGEVACAGIGPMEADSAAHPQETVQARFHALGQASASPAREPE